MVANHSARMLSIKDRYIEAGQEWPATAKQVATWAVCNKLYAQDPGKSVQEWFWDDVRDGNYDHANLAFRQRHKSIVDEIDSFQADLESYNRNYLPAGEQPLLFEFGQAGAEEAQEETII